MDTVLQKARSHSRFVLYILGFLWAINLSLPSYIQSSFLSEIVGERYVGLAYSAASVVTILFFFCIPKLLERFGNYRMTVTMLTVMLGSLMGMAVLKQPIFVLPLFVASFMCGALINFFLDIYLETVSSQNSMGKVRGIFLTSVNIAWVVSPLLTSFILTNGDYWKIFMSAGVIVIPIIFLLFADFKNFKDPQYIETPFWTTRKEIWTNKNVLGSFMVSFLLQFFFAWMTIYTPIYLHHYIGFSWVEISLMLSIIFLPFALVEFPLGRLADTRYGEKEMLSIGFIIMALSTAMISFIDTKNFALWTTLLLVTRIGASIVEIMSETYFFKKIDGQSVGIMSMFRTMRPASYVLSPILATALFAFGLDMKYLFIILGLLMFYGLRHSLALEDTR